MIKRKIATSVTIGSFGVAGVTGFFIFFEFGTGAVRATHEWSSIVFVVAAIFHVIVHVRPFTKYFKERTIIYIGVACFAGIILFFQSKDDIYAAEAAYQVVIHSDLSSISILLDQDIRQIKNQLERLGVHVSDTNLSIVELADIHQVDVYDIIEPLLAN